MTAKRATANQDSNTPQNGHPLNRNALLNLRVFKMTRLTLALVLVACAAFVGCSTTRTTDTARTGMEQLLISNAVDQTIAKTALPDVAGQKVFLEEKYLDSVDKGYIIGSLRRKLLNAGAMLVDKKEDSQITVELCSGGVGTDNVERYVGMPGLTVPGLPVELPEVRLYEKKSQFGTAKLNVVAYDTPSGQMVYDGSGTLARADDSNWTILGLGPFQDGSVRSEVNRNTADTDFTARVANTIDFDAPTYR